MSKPDGQPLWTNNEADDESEDDGRVIEASDEVNQSADGEDDE
jgi:hypothetical protein